MNEVKRPKKTLAYFYCIAALLLATGQFITHTPKEEKT